MNRERKIFIIIISLSVLILLFRKVAFEFITKNWEKEIYTHETVDYEIRMAINKTMGCVDIKYNFTAAKDSITFYNYKLENILVALAQKNLNTSQINGPIMNNEIGYNFSYFSKDPTQNIVIHREEVLNKLGDKLNFTYRFDTMAKKVYVPVISDSIRFKKVLKTEKNERIKASTDYIEFYGCSLNSIFNFISQRIPELIIEPAIHDSNFYSFSLQSRKKEDIMSYFNAEFGISFTDSKKDFEILIVDFQK